MGRVVDISFFFFFFEINPLIFFFFIVEKEGGSSSPHHKLWIERLDAFVNYCLLKFFLFLSFP